ncbi:MAG: two-component regulator propeller domain-containing protein, partial [Verrucomicrobiota bacterium]
MKHEAQAPNSLSSDDISCLHEDSRGFLWVGTYYGGLNRIDPKRRVIRRYRASGEGTLPHPHVSSIIEGANGRIWISTLGGGLVSLDPETGQTQRWKTEDPGQPSPSLGINVLFRDAGDAIWVGTLGDGLGRIDPRSGEYRIVWPEPYGITSICQDSDRKIWFTTIGAGLFRYDPANDSVLNLRNDPEDPTSILSNQANCVIEDRHGRLWIGTNRGLSSLDRETLTFHNFSHHPGRHHSLVGHEVSAICQDRIKPILWITCRDGGVSKLKLEVQGFDRHQTAANLEDGLSNDSVTAFCQDSYDNLWIGTNTGLNRQNRRTGKFDHFFYDPEDPASISSNEITALLEDKSGRIWIGTRGTGLNHFDPETQSFTRYVHKTGREGSLPHDTILTLMRRNDGEVWIGTPHGFALFDPASGLFESHRLDIGLNESHLNLRLNYISALTGGPEQSLWVGTHYGLCRYWPATRTTERILLNGPDDHLLENIAALKTDSLGHLWIGTLGAGLVQYRPEEKSHTLFDRSNSRLPHNNALGLAIEPRTNAVWISTSNGLTRLNPEKGNFRRFRVEDGLQSLTFNPGSAYVGRDGM